MPKKKKQLTEAQWVKENEGRPWDFDEMANDAAENASGELQQLAQSFCINRDQLEQKLEDLEYEFG